MRIFSTALLFVVLVFVFTPALRGQGSLTPPGAPGPVFKTLLQVEPRTPIDSIPSNSLAAHFINQPGSYYLTTNLNLNGNREGIRVQASDVTIDLNGFTIFGHTNNVGIVGGITGIKNVRICNGILSRWATAIDFASFNTISNIVVEDIRVDGGVPGITNRAGIAVGAAGVIRRCNVFGNFGFSTRCIEANVGSIIEQCSVFDGSVGISLLGQARVENCWVQNASASGILAPQPSTIRNNHIFACGIGISVTSNSWVADNLVDSSTSDGIRMTGSYNHIERNTVVNSASAYRMGFTATTNFLVQNVSQRNVGSYTFVGGSIIGGPIVTVSSNITTTSPWVNFSVP
jgi:parallel beta-helix repeat protein